MVNRADIAISDHRSGVTLVELLVSVTALLTVMTLTTTLCFQVQRVWQDIRQHQVAVGELSNQLEQLTQLQPARLATDIEKLTPSATCARTLRQPKLSGTLTEDKLGTRITLALDWQRRHPGKTITLTGWLNPGEKGSSTQSETNR